MAGAPLIYVQKQLGHSSIQMTADLYMHWIELADRAASADAPLPIDLLVPSS
jgi:integrase